MFAEHTESSGPLVNIEHIEIIQGGLECNGVAVRLRGTGMNKNELSKSEKEAGLQCPVSMELVERIHWAQLQLSLLRFCMPLALAWAKYHQVSSARIPTPTSLHIIVLQCPLPRKCHIVFSVNRIVILKVDI